MNIFRNSHYFKKFIKNEKYRKRKKIKVCNLKLNLIWNKIKIIFI